MSTVLSQIASPTVLLYTFLIVTQIAQGFYLGSQIEPPPGFTLGYRLAFLWIIGWWLLRDSRKRGVALVFDTGFFLSIAWPVIMPYYLFKSRGAKGLLIILGFLGAYIGAQLVGVVLYVLLIPTAH
jgi:hypothetical protein